MPELPEVETIRRQLEKSIKGATIKSVEVRNAKPLKVSRKEFEKAITGATIKNIKRRAKLLIFEFSNGDAALFHLKMTGRMLLVLKDAQPTKHTHIVFYLSGRYDLFFEDYRKFGFVKIFKKQPGGLENYLDKQGYGPEPLEPEFVFKTMKARLLVHPNKKIKEILMDQSCVAGIGNIYAAEICFYAGVRPDRKIGEIAEGEFKKIYDGAKKILKAAVTSRGSSADAYVDAHGKQGTYVPKLKVYGREGKKCARCGSIIKKEKIGGRGTYWCPKCQK
jgi:formamidopyrimidine-DNA glycosylase